MKRESKSNTLVLILFLISTLILSSCSNDEPTNPGENSPDLPPQSTFIMDFTYKIIK